MSNLCRRAGCRGRLDTVQDSDPYQVGNRVLIHSYGEQIYSHEEFSKKDEAINRAKANAWETVRAKFHGVGQMDIDWDIREERPPDIRKS
jgi:hypothetical protein